LLQNPLGILRTRISALCIFRTSVINSFVVEKFCPNYGNVAILDIGQSSQMVIKKLELIFTPIILSPDLLRYN
jgi:hypothetical protein